MINLRTYSILDSLQPQMASFISTVSKGFLPVADQACCVIEIAPGIEINRLLDVALKKTNVLPGMQVVERSYGMLEIHSDEQGDIRAAGEAILEEIGQKEENRIRPKVLTSQLIKNVTDHHAQMINRTRHGHMLLKGDTLYVLEIEPAGYAFYAANEAEKGANINLIEVRGIGAFGRVYLGGEEKDIVEARDIIETKLSEISGQESNK
jgi:hypothetical protein